MRRVPSRAAAGGLLVAGALLMSGAGAAGQDEALPERDGLTGLEWRFVRIRYSTPPDQLAEFKRIYWVDPWEVDAPVAEQNLSRRMARVTSLQVNEPIILELTDEALWEHPWIYIVEPANLMLTDAEVDILREFLLRGGTVTFDDFHGPREWALFERQMARVFPDRDIVRLPAVHPSSVASTSSTSTRRSPASGPTSTTYRGRRAGSRRSSTGFSTTTAGRWRSSTSTPTWGTAGSGPTPSSIRATSSTRRSRTACSSTRSSMR